MSGQNVFVKTLNLVVLDKKERQPGHPFIKDISLICTFGHLKNQGNYVLTQNQNSLTF